MYASETSQELTSKSSKVLLLVDLIHNNLLAVPQDHVVLTVTHAPYVHVSADGEDVGRVQCFQLHVVRADLYYRALQGGLLQLLWLLWSLWSLISVVTVFSCTW